MIIQIITIVALYWILASLLGYFSLLKIFKKYSKYPNITTPQHYEGFLRKDFGKWNKQKMLKRCFTHFPISFYGFMSFHIYMPILILIWKYCKIPKKFVSFFRRNYGKFCTKLIMRVQQSFDNNQLIKTAIIVSNHVCFMDILYVGCFTKNLVGFVSKKEVQSLPLAGYIADFLQCIYIDRKSTNGREQIKKDIQQRGQQFLKNPQSKNPLVIFPQGTVSNGRSVMQFKNGAFEALLPITLMSLRYESKDFHLSQAILGLFQHVILVLCSQIKLIVNKTIIYPQVGQSVESYAERSRDQIAKMGNFKKYNCNYKDIIAYNQQIKQILKKS